MTDLAQKEHPDVEIKTARAEGLRDCRKLMTLAKAGKYNGYGAISSATKQTAESSATRISPTLLRSIPSPRIEPR